MEKEYEFGPINAIAIYGEDGQFSLELSSSEAHYHYHSEDNTFLEEVDAICDIIYPDDWEDLIDIILVDEGKETLLSKISHDGGGDYYHCYCDDEATLLEFCAFLDDLLKDKNKFLKYLKKLRGE
jgi:hypothetical protein